MSTQRRRGPGKAKKGSRSRKDDLPNMGTDLGKYINVIPLHTFGAAGAVGGRTSRSRSAEDHSDAKDIQTGS